MVDAIRTALAMGADNGIHVEIPETADNNLAAKALAGALKKEPKVDVVFTGKEAIDDGAAQTSQLIAEHAGYASVTVVLGTEYTATSVKCKREVEGGAVEMIEAQFPVVIAAQKGLNEPRYGFAPEHHEGEEKRSENAEARRYRRFGKRIRKSVTRTSRCLLQKRPVRELPVT